MMIMIMIMMMMMMITIAIMMIDDGLSVATHHVRDLLALLLREALVLPPRRHLTHPL